MRVVAQDLVTCTSDRTGTEACVTGTVCRSSLVVSLPDLLLPQGERLVQVHLSVLPCCATPGARSPCPLLSPASPSAAGGSEVQLPVTPGKGNSGLSFFSLSPHPTLSPLYTPAIPLLLFFSPRRRCRQSFVLQPAQTLTPELATTYQAFSSLCSSPSWTWSTRGTESRGRVR